MYILLTPASEGTTSSLDQSMSHDAFLYFFAEKFDLKTACESFILTYKLIQVVFRPLRDLICIFQYQKIFFLMFYFNIWIIVYILPSSCEFGCMGLRVLSVQKLFLWWCDTAVPGAGAVCPLDTGVVVSLASVHLLLNHQVCPQTLLRSGNRTGQGRTADDL